MVYLFVEIKIHGDEGQILQMHVELLYCTFTVSTYQQPVGSDSFSSDVHTDVDRSTPTSRLRRYDKAKRPGRREAHISQGSRTYLQKPEQEKARPKWTNWQEEHQGEQRSGAVS